jgi:DNA-binding CsgD family transcriptional regulator
MKRPDEIDRGRECYAARQWGEAYRALASADRQQPLVGDDLERLAAAAYLAGDDAAALDAWTRAYHLHADAGHIDRAAFFGCWISLISILGRDFARGTGWLSRAQRLLKDAGDFASRGYVLVLEGLLALSAGGPADAKFAEAVVVAERFGDADLLALGLLGGGQALIGQQRFAEGAALLDEAMVGVSSGEVSPILCGIIYCAVILTCQDILDMGRAREWTIELDAWCVQQQGLRPFRGQCLVHRSEILQQKGDWTAALSEAVGASRHVAGRSERVVGHALYQRAEISRLRGEHEEADRLYKAAAASGHEPQPGASLLLLAQGDVEAAAAAIRGALDVAGEPTGFGRALTRPRLLGPFVEIQLAAGNIDAAEAATEELAQRAIALQSPVLHAQSQQSLGMVHLAKGMANEATAALREAWSAWQRQEMPYEAARVRVLIGTACQMLGDALSARPHFEAARAVFARIGAAPELAEVEARLLAETNEDDTGLTPRQREVLGLVTSGASNREIAAQLAISEHTVARHVSNIFDKLAVNSRTEASAIAHARKIV